ncbi:MAG TPA: hypothetical protein VJU86_06390 [Pyrinomonadaceae bacterium]|nr:hypothetical protein [Pyrinomonadaceae bacterium]
MMKLIFLLAIVVLFTAAVFGQELQSSLPAAEVEIVPATARGCQRNTINVANLHALVQTTEEKAFVIAHLGTGETNPRLNRRRLNDVKTQFGLGDSPKIIFAEGAQVRGLGRIDFYPGSELMSITLLARNGDFCATCCDRKKLFYKERTVWRFYPHKRR